MQISTDDFLCRQHVSFQTRLGSVGFGGNVVATGSGRRRDTFDLFFAKSGSEKKLRAGDPLLLRTTVGEEEIADVVAQWTGVPVPSNAEKCCFFFKTTLQKDYKCFAFFQKCCLFHQNHLQTNAVSFQRQHFGGEYC